MGTLQLIHAKTDMDISSHQTEMICAEIFGHDAAGAYAAGEEGLLLDVREEDKPRVKVQIVEHGGKFFFGRIWWPYEPFADDQRRAQQDHDLFDCRHCCCKSFWRKRLKTTLLFR